MLHKEVALKIEYFYNDEDLNFQVASKKGMLSILQGIAEQDARVTLHYGNGQHFILTTLLGANEHGIWLAATPFPRENRQLLLNDKITFVSLYQGVKIQFVARHIENDRFEGNEAFYMELPDYLLRIQRRDFYRAPIPSGARVRCIIPVRPENPDHPPIMREVPIVDISSGGIGLLCSEHEATLLPNKIFPDCRISLPHAAPLTATIEVRNSTPLSTPNNVVYKRIGCRFIQLDNQASTLLQHHIASLQSENMAKRHLAVPH